MKRSWANSVEERKCELCNPDTKNRERCSHCVVEAKTPMTECNKDVECSECEISAACWTGEISDYYQPPLCASCGKPIEGEVFSLGNDCFDADCFCDLEICATPEKGVA